MKNKLTYFLVLLFLCFFSSSISFGQEYDKYKKQLFTVGKDTLKYRILYPRNFSEHKKYPVILFLHGAGERGNDNKTQLVHGGDLFLKKDIREKFPSIVIFPQVPKDDYWANVEVERDVHPFKLDFHQQGAPTRSLSLAMKLMDSITSKKFVNKNKIYVAGLSMGGMGTYEILSRKPNMFAAAIAICGAADSSIVKKYQPNLDIWIFHGLKDDIVNPKYAMTMARVINSYGGNAKLSLYPNDNHNSWDSALAEPNLLPWLFSKSKKQK